jgi:hypothetical protein
MKTASTIVGILILLISCSISRNDKNVNSYLKDKYEIDWDEMESVSVEEMPVYYDKDNPPQIEKLDVEFLGQKTGYEFNKTILNTAYLEYPELRMIIAVPKSNEDEIRELMSPTFTDVSQDFINIFQGLKTNSEEEKMKLIKEISGLFEKITYEGAIKNIEKKDENFTSELWHGRLKWRILYFDFEEDILVKLEIGNPKSSFTKIENE